MYEILYIDPQDNVRIVCKNNEPAQYPTQDEAWDTIMLIQQMENRPAFKLMWTRRVPT